ncbi:MAG: transcriptional regulator [Phycisphaeraceae bacterium]|nr:transcriptional regulator [Phycisphaeraceae bacterium]
MSAPAKSLSAPQLKAIMATVAEPFAKALATFVCQCYERSPEMVLETLKSPLSTGASPADPRITAWKTQLEAKARELASAWPDGEPPMGKPLNWKTPEDAIAWRIRMAIDQKGWSQADLAKRLKVSESTVSRMLRWPGKVKTAQWRRVCEIVGVDDASLLRTTSGTRTSIR